MVGIAETGSGKTLAFFFTDFEPFIKKEAVPKVKGKVKMPFIAPTRELAMQTTKCCQPRHS